MPSLTLDSFDGGLDVRAGAFSTKQNKFRELTNCYPTSGKKIARRPPLKQQSGTFGTDTSGIFLKDSVLYTYAPRGGGLTLPTGTTALYYDAPVSSTGATLLDVVSLNNVPCAVFKHTYASGAWIYALHVFDGAPDALTLVMDPAFPWATHISPTKRITLGAAAGKIYIGGPTGDTYFSAVGRPRVWNLRTADFTATSGFDFIFYVPAAGTVTVTIPLNNVNLTTSMLVGYTGSIMQRFWGGANDNQSDDSLWGDNAAVTGYALTEVTAAPAAGQFMWNAAGTANIATKTTFSTWGSYTLVATVAGFYRFRVQSPLDVATGYRPNDILTGIFQFNPSVLGLAIPTMYFFGNGGKRYSLNATFFPSGVTSSWIVKIDGAVKAYTVDFTVVRGQDNVPQILFVVAVTAVQQVEVAQQTVPSTSLTICIPPGTVRTPTGTKTFVGQDVIVPASSTSIIYIAVNKDGSIGAAAAVAIGTFTRTQQYQSVLVLQVTSDASTVTYSDIPGLKFYRKADADLTLYRLARGMAGSLDAGFLPTSKHPSGGGTVSDLTGTKDRLLVRFPAGAQLWSVHADPTQDAIVSLLPIGSGTQTVPYGVLFYRQSVIVPSTSGLRSVAMQSNLQDGMHDDQNIGDAIAGLGTIVFLSATFWPKMSCYVAAVTINGVFALLTLHYHLDGDIVGWARWTFTGLTTVDYRGLVASDDRLYIRSGVNLFYLDASAVINGGQFYDYNETTATAYTSRAAWHFNDFKAPMAQKHASEIAVLQTGKATFSFKVNPYDETMVTPGIVIVDSTIGRPKVPLCAWGMGLALIMQSNDYNGHQLDGVSIEYRVVKR